MTTLGRTLARFPALRWVAATVAGLLAIPMMTSPAWADTVRHAQWYLDALHIPEAQQITRGDGVIVGLVDGLGVDEAHADLTGQVLPGTGFGTGAASNGWSSSPEAVHATAMAGIIAAKGGGPNHALGIAPAAKILPVAVGGDSKRVDSQLSAQGVRWATDHGAKVINLSFAGNDPASAAEADAVRYAQAHDVVVVAGAGNTVDGTFAVGAPANLPGVVAVSGANNTGGWWSGSAHGPQVAVAAPAVGIVTTAPVSPSYPAGYQQVDGTSAATAIVSGVVALIRAKYPQLDAANVIERLIATAKDQPPAGRDDDTGFGTVRPLDALTATVPSVTSNPLGSAPSATPSATSSVAVSPKAGSVPAVLLVTVIGVGVLVLLAVVVVVVVVRRSRRPTASAPMVGIGGPAAGRYPPTPPRR